MEGSVSVLRWEGVHMLYFEERDMGKGKTREGEKTIRVSAPTTNPSTFSQAPPSQPTPMRNISHHKINIHNVLEQHTAHVRPHTVHTLQKNTNTVSSVLTIRAVKQRQQENEDGYYLQKC